MNMVGYLTKRADGLFGERGLAYDYILSGNGLWIEAEGILMAARVPVAEAVVRGLDEMEDQVVLRHGPIPQLLFDLALSEMSKDVSREKYVAVVWRDEAYHLEVPEQEMTGGSVHYQNPDNVVLDIHSHGKMRAFFSSQDDIDEQGFKLYCVVGKLNDDMPMVLLRVGVYGYFHLIQSGQVFNGSLQRVVEVAEAIEQEVEYALQGEDEGQGRQHRHSNRRDWWNRLLRR